MRKRIIIAPLIIIIAILLGLFFISRITNNEINRALKHTFSSIEHLNPTIASIQYQKAGTTLLQMLNRSFSIHKLKITLKLPNGPIILPIEEINVQGQLKNEGNLPEKLSLSLSSIDLHALFEYALKDPKIKNTIKQRWPNYADELPTYWTKAKPMAHIHLHLDQQTQLIDTQIKLFAFSNQFSAIINYAFDHFSVPTSNNDAKLRLMTGLLNSQLDSSNTTITLKPTVFNAQQIIPAQAHLLKLLGYTTLRVSGSFKENYQRKTGINSRLYQLTLKDGGNLLLATQNKLLKPVTAKTIWQWLQLKLSTNNPNKQALNTVKQLEQSTDIQSMSLTYSENQLVHRLINLYAKSSGMPLALAKESLKHVIDQPSGLDQAISEKQAKAIRHSLKAFIVDPKILTGQFVPKKPITVYHFRQRIDEVQASYLASAEPSIAMKDQGTQIAQAQLSTLLTRMNFSINANGENG